MPLHSSRLPASLVLALSLAACGGSSDAAIDRLTEAGADGAPGGIATDAAIDSTVASPDDAAPPVTSADAGIDAPPIPEAGTVTDGSTAPDASPGSRACIPGQSVACVGPGGCSTNQVCVADGSGFGPCVCAPVDASALACVPGQSVGCVGPGGCSTNQVCASDGAGYGPCVCLADASIPACVPGQSIACGGPLGCTSNQICISDGSGYGPCDCPDAGGDAGGEGGASWSPAQLPGLALWLDDTYGVVMDPQYPGLVLHWLDRSGNGNDATMYGGYNAVGGATVWTGFALDPEAVNGLDGIRCGGDTSEGGWTNISLDEARDLDWGSENFAIVMVVVPDGNYLWNGNGLLLSASPDSFTLGANGNSIGISVPDDGRFKVVTASGQTLQLMASGAVSTGPLAGALTPGRVALCSGSQSELAEVIAVQGTVSAADTANLAAYFHVKFGL